jgi:antitoxin HicB
MLWLSPFFILSAIIMKKDCGGHLMAVYEFYAIIEKVEDEGIYSVSFPDLENCFTDGESLVDAVGMAEDALGALLSVMEDKGEPIPAPSKAKDIELPEGASLVLIQVNTDDFRD